MEDKLYRRVTHQDYGNPNFEKDFKKTFHYIEKCIYTDEVVHVNKEVISEKGEIYFADNQYMSLNSAANTIPIWGGGISLFLLVVFLWGEDITNPKIWDVGMFFFIGIPLFFLIFCIVYYFTMPKKETIFDRMRGTITFTGWIWQKNITMPFNKILFKSSTGGEDMVGAFMLEIVRPNRTFVSSSFGHECYQSMAAITWYMDKNRPLPPGTAFDPYREADFERRKAEGFPPPLYPSQVPTLEATPEQQKEREKYWGG